MTSPRQTLSGLSRGGISVSGARSTSPLSAAHQRTIFNSSHANSMRNERKMCKLHQLLLPLLLLPILASCVRVPEYVERHMNASANACEDFYEHACGNWAQAHADDDYRSQLEQLDYEYHKRLATLLELPQATDQPRFVRLLRDNYAACRALDGRYKASQFVRWLRVWSGVDVERDESDWWPLLRLLMGYGLSALLPPADRADDAELWLLQLQPPWPLLAEDESEQQQQLLHRARFRRLYRALQPLGVPEPELWLAVKELERQLGVCASSVNAEEETGTEQPPDLVWLLPLPLVETMTPASWPAYLRCVSARLDGQSPALLARYLQLRLLHKLQLLPAPSFGRQECAAQARHLLTHAAVWLLQQQQLPAQWQLANVTLQQLFEQLRANFKLRLVKNRNGFSRSAQGFLLAKLRRMRLRLGVLPDGDAAQQRQHLEAHYAALELNASDYYGNLRAVLRQTERWALADRPAGNLFLLQSDGFGSYASPFFLPSRNMIVLPHSLLDEQLYAPHQAAVLALSGLGFLVAHEMSHGFAPSDVVYDWRGQRQQPVLRASRRFASQSQCLRGRYGQMTDEKFADFNGLGLALATFRASNLSEESLEAQRIFFRHFAQFFCQDDQLLKDSSQHGGSRERVNDAVASSASFALAFGCKLRQNRNRCQLY